LELFQVGWPKKIWLAVWPVFGLILSQLALKNVFDLLALFWLFSCWNRFLWRKILLFHLFGYKFANFCDQFYIRCRIL